MEFMCSLFNYQRPEFSVNVLPQFDVYKFSVKRYSDTKKVHMCGYLKGHVTQKVIELNICKIKLILSHAVLGNADTM